MKLSTTLRTLKIVPAKAGDAVIKASDVMVGK